MQELLHTGETKALDAQKTEAFHMRLDNLRQHLCKFFYSRFGLRLSTTCNGRLTFDISTCTELDVLWLKYNDGELWKEFASELIHLVDVSYFFTLRLSEDEYIKCKEALTCRHDANFEQRLVVELAVYIMAF